MGRHYSLMNVSKGQNVISYFGWKGCRPDINEILQIANILSWDLSNEVITSSTYDDLYVLEENEWKQIQFGDSLDFEYPTLIQEFEFKDGKVNMITQEITCDCDDDEFLEF